MHKPQQPSTTMVSRPTILYFLMTISSLRALIVRSPCIQRRVSTSFRRFGGSAPRQRRADYSSPGTLEWESFEFSSSPKWDARFNETQSVMAATEDELAKITEAEQHEDEQIAKRFNQQSDAMQLVSPQIVQHATRVLSPYIQPNRLQRMNSVLEKRTAHCRFLFENPANPSNVWACLRTIDSFGIQNVDLIIESPFYQGKAALSQKRGMRTAMGSAQWLSLHNHASTKEAISCLKKDGYRIYASDLNPSSKDIRDIDWNHDNPICIVMGNENNGITEEMRQLADETFTLPMWGFAESFNLSVATAITLAHLSACSTAGRGPLRPGDMPTHELNCLRLRGVLNSLAHKKLGKAVLRKEGIVLPPGWL